MQRMREAGFDLTLEHKSKNSSQGFYLHETTRLVLQTFGTPRRMSLNVGAEYVKANKLPPKLFLCMNRQPHKHRRAIVCYLLYRGFLQHSLVSFHDNHPLLAPDCCDGVEMKAAWKELQKLLPLTIDNDLPLEFEAYFRDNAAVVKIGELWPYRDTCFSIVTETLFCNDRMFVSEKLWKPILIGHPFVVVGTPGTLAYLHSQGFKTFAPTIDENYDTQVNDEDRMHALIFKTIDALGSLDDSKTIGAAREIATHCDAQHAPVPATAIANGKSLGRYWCSVGRLMIRGFHHYLRRLRRNRDRNNQPASRSGQIKSAQKSRKWTHY